MGSEHIQVDSIEKQILIQGKSDNQLDLIYDMVKNR